MASFNKVILIGNLTRDPELRQTPSGSSICKFSIAISRSFPAQDGSMREETCFIDIDAFGRSAENVSKYFTRGKPILVEGRLKLDVWEDKNSGETKRKHSVVLEKFEFVSSKAQDDNGYSQNTKYEDAPYQKTKNYSSSNSSSQSKPAMEDVSDDDIPF